MDSKDEENIKTTSQEEGTPLCLGCLRPVDPLYHYCPHCGEAVGQLTPYIPFVNIRWQMSFWGKAWRQVWSSEVSFMGRLFRLFMIMWNVPILLLGLLFRPWRNSKEDKASSMSNRSNQMHL